MAAAANFTDKEREGLGRALPADIPGHHCVETAYRDGRYKRR